MHIRGKTQEALDYLTALISRHPDAADFIFSRGEFLYEVGYLESARQDLLKAIKFGAVNSLIFQYLAIIEIKQNNPHQAIRLFESALKIDPENHTVWLHKAKLEYQLSKFEEAYKSCSQAIQLNSTIHSHHQLLVAILYNSNNQEALEKHLKLMIQKFPNNIWAGLHLVSVFIQKKEFKGAYNLLRILREKHPNNIDILQFLGDILSAVGKLKEAIVVYRKILDMKPDYTDVTIKLAKNYLRLKDLGLAEKYLVKATEEDTKDLFVYEKLAQIYNGYNDTFAAEKVIIEGLRINRRNIALILEYANILTKRNKLGKAITAYEQALTLNRNNYKILGNLGELYRLTGNIEKAEEMIDQALQLNPNAAWVRILQIELLQQKNELENALVEIDRLIQLDPKNLYSYRKKAILLMNTGKFEQAYKAIETAVKLDPSSLSLGILKGNILSQLERYREAESTFEEVLNIVPNNAAILTQMAYIQLHTNKTRALNTITKSLDKEIFDVITLELYLYLKGEAADLWEIETDSAEYAAYEHIMRREFKLAETAIDQLKRKGSVYSDYFTFLLNLLNNRKEAKLEISTDAADIAWFSFYHAIYVSANNEPNEAIRLLERSLRLNPNLHWAKVRLAILYESAKRYQEAITLIDTYLTKHPNSYWAKIRLALNYDFTKQPAKAEEIYLKILDANKNDRLSLNNLAWLYLTAEDKKFKKINEALALAKKAVEIKANSENLDTLAEAYFQKKKYKKALRAIEQALDKDRTNRDYFKKQKKKIQSAMDEEL